MKALGQIADAMREHGIRRLVLRDVGIELELSESHMPLPAESSTGPTSQENATEMLDRTIGEAAGNLCVGCRKIKAEGLIPGYCRPCGKRLLNAQS